MLRWMPVFFLLISFSTTAQVNKIKQIDARRYQAMVDRDTVYLQKVLSNDLTYIHSRGRVDTKEAYIKSISSGRLDYLSINIIDVQVRMYDRIALLNGTVHMIFTAPDTNNVHMRFTAVYHNIQGEWKLVSVQNARIEPPMPVGKNEPLKFGHPPTVALMFPKILS